MDLEMASVYLRIAASASGSLPPRPTIISSVSEVLAWQVDVSQKRKRDSSNNRGCTSRASICSVSRIELNSIPHTLRWINHLLFSAVKMTLALLMTFLLSVCLARPLYIPLPHAADLLQILFFVLFALLAVRWSFHDQEQRCKHCLCSLATPARVGRPSHNLLEWSGTEQTCRHGHGRLSIPEIETSWHQYSRWIDQSSSLDHLSRA